jgi:RHS repeat-associated protein
VPNGDPNNTGSVFDNPLRFPGTYADRETNTLYNWYRNLDPARDQYLQPEPLGLAGDISLYRYARNNPLSVIDPDGRNPVTGGAIGGTIGGPPGAVIGGVIGLGLGITLGQMLSKPAANDPNCPDCDKEYAELMQEYSWIIDFEALNVPYDPLQGLWIRQAKIEYNRHARPHNARCPNKVPLFLVRETRYIK